MIKQLTYINLVYGIIYFFQVTNTTGPTTTGDQLSALGLILTIVFNWEALKLIKGQKRKLSKFSFSIGLVTILFGGLLIIDSILRLTKVIDLQGSIVGPLFLIGLEFIFATTIMIQAIGTFKKHLTKESTTANTMIFPSGGLESS